MGRKEYLQRVPGPAEKIRQVLKSAIPLVGWLRQAVRPDSGLFPVEPNAYRICRGILEGQNRCPTSRCRPGGGSRLTRKSKRCRIAPRPAAPVGKNPADRENLHANGPRTLASERWRRGSRARTKDARARLPGFGGEGPASPRWPAWAMRWRIRRSWDKSKRCRIEIACADATRRRNNRIE